MELTVEYIDYRKELMANVEHVKKMIAEKEVLPILLKKCKEVGYTAISINMTHEVVTKLSGTCSPHWGKGMIFTGPKIRSRNDPWPRIWEITRELNIHGGCGNAEQVQTKNFPIDPVTYVLQDDEWVKIT